MRNKLIALFLVLGLAASVTACGGSPKTESGEDGTPLTEDVDTEAGEIEEAGIEEAIEEPQEDFENIEAESEGVDAGQDIQEDLEDTEEAN